MNYSWTIVHELFMNSQVHELKFMNCKFMNLTNFVNLAISCSWIVHEPFMNKCSWTAHDLFKNHSWTVHDHFTGPTPPPPPSHPPLEDQSSDEGTTLFIGPPPNFLYVCLWINFMSMDQFYICLWINFLYIIMSMDHLMWGHLNSELKTLDMKVINSFLIRISIAE